MLWNGYTNLLYFEPILIGLDLWSILMHIIATFAHRQRHLIDSQSRVSSRMLFTEVFGRRWILLPMEFSLSQWKDLDMTIGWRLNARIRLCRYWCNCWLENCLYSYLMGRFYACLPILYLTEIFYAKKFGAYSHVTKEKCIHEGRLNFTPTYIIFVLVGSYPIPPLLVN